jgi:hypothetical protein
MLRPTDVPGVGHSMTVTAAAVVHPALHMHMHLPSFTSPDPVVMTVLLRLQNVSSHATHGELGSRDRQTDRQTVQQAVNGRR